MVALPRLHGNSLKYSYQPLTGFVLKGVKVTAIWGKPFALIGSKTRLYQQQQIKCRLIHVTAFLLVRGLFKLYNTRDYRNVPSVYGIKTKSYFLFQENRMLEDKMTCLLNNTFQTANLNFLFTFPKTWVDRAMGNKTFYWDGLAGK